MSKPASLLPTPKGSLRITLVLFTAIVVSVLIFMLVALFIEQTKGPLMPQLNNYTTIFTGLMAVLLIVCIWVAKRVFNKGIAAAKNSLNPLHGKLNRHRLSLIRYLVICEIPAVVSIVLFMLTGDFVFQVFAAIFLGFMLALTPVSRRVVALLELDGQQQKELE
jgi:hypothetical protein